MVYLLKKKITMEAQANDNKIIESNTSPEDVEFKYNFINTPWDDRSKINKIGIILLLLSIFLITVALVVNNFFMHFKGFRNSHFKNDTTFTCHSLARIDDNLGFAARIVSVATKELVCVGAVVSPTSVVASGICMKFQPLKMFIGSILDPRCKKGFSVDVFDTVPHEALVSKKVVILSSYEVIDMCSRPISMSTTLDWNSKVLIIGRPINWNHRFLTKRYAAISSPYEQLTMRFDKKATICLRDSARCPVRAGDLMLQGGKLIGLAVSSLNRKRVACFADLRIVKEQLQEFDEDIA